MVLDDAERGKLDERDDDVFYTEPRLVTHVDAGFRERLTALYDEVLMADDRGFEAMSSHVAHLPNRQFDRVVGHGMNATELAANDRLDDWFVQNLNETPTLPLDDAAFDAVTCAVSVQYLQRPEAVFAEFARVLTPGGVLVVSISDRMFPTKAVRAWWDRSMDERADLVVAYAESTDRFTETRVVTDHPDRDPFVAIVAQRA